MYLYFVLRNFPLISLYEHLTIFVATVELNAMSFFSSMIKLGLLVQYKYVFWVTLAWLHRRSPHPLNHDRWIFTTVLYI